MTAATLEEVLSGALDRHAWGQDFHCACGEDFFGGTAAYSWTSWSSHRTAHVTAAVRSWLADRLADEDVLEAVCEAIALVSGEMDRGETTAALAAVTAALTSPPNPTATQEPR